MLQTGLNSSLDTLNQSALLIDRRERVIDSFNTDLCGTDNAHINRLPLELIVKIFSYLDFACLRNVCLTCRKWELLLKLENIPNIWKRLVFKTNSCSKQWSQYHDKSNSIMRDPAIGIRQEGYVGLSKKGEKVLRTIVAERNSPLKEILISRSLQITNGVLLCGP